jgi:starch-binding outer membrane protein, SusD/RagB family
MKYPTLILLVWLGCMLGNCTKILDKKPLVSVPGNDTWNDPNLAEAFISTIYFENLPQWDRGISDLSEESDGGNAYMYGQLTENSVDYWPYGAVRNNHLRSGNVYYGEIRSINILLADIDKGSIDAGLKKRMKGEAYFFRAWQYFEMVKRYGGVPLILKPQDTTDNIYVKRASTSATIKQVIADLDSAVVNQPAISASLTATNDGHVHKGTALAIKGRVLLYWASPQFNPGNDAARWQEAYNVNKQARDSLVAKGFGLYENFANIWLNEMNKEVIFVRRYSNPAHTHSWSAATRPLDMSQGAQGSNQPTWEMVQAFPMDDGRPIAGHPNYNAVTYWQNRDPRFKATIAYNGAPWALSGQSGRIQYTYVGAEVNSPTLTGFYARKAVIESQTSLQAFNSDTDYPELRFAEVLLNLAEAANATGKTNEAYTQLIEVRKRAGIKPGANNLFGLDANMTQAQMQDAIMYERQIEFAFEGKRHWDLRRNMLFENKLNGTKRTGLKITLKPGVTKAQVDKLTLAELEANYNQYFQHQVITLDTQFPISWKPNYYFYGLPSQHLQLNRNLEQTKGWPNGTFDPLL